MARKATITPSQVQDAMARLKKGDTLAKIAKGFNVTGPGLKAAINRYKSQLAKNPPKPAPALEVLSDEDNEPDEDNTTDAKDFGVSEDMTAEEQRNVLTQVIRDLRTQSKELERAGEVAESRRATESALKAMAILARITPDDDEGRLVLSREEIGKIARGAKQKIEALLRTKRPLLCAGCHAELGRKWVTDDD